MTPVEEAAKLIGTEIWTYSHAASADRHSVSFYKYQVIGLRVQPDEPLYLLVEGEDHDERVPLLEAYSTLSAAKLAAMDDIT